MILHILKKDARRLWPAILLSLVVLASLAWHDSRRSDWMAGEIEQQLTLLVLGVWAFLIGLAVEQDPIAGDRQFWITRPYRRGALLAAKALFAALFVHVPSLLADCFVVAARGFSPAAYAGHLLARQLMLALSLTLPAMALAALVRSFKHFLLEAVAVIAVGLLVVGWRPAAINWGVFEAIRQQSTLVVLGCAAAVVVALSYLRRRVMISRTVAAAAGCIACLMFVLFAPQSALGVRSAIAGRPARLSLRLDSRPATVGTIWRGPTTVVFPIAVDGVPEGAHVALLPLWSEISGKARSYREDSYRPSDSSPYSIGFTWPYSGLVAPRSILVTMTPAALEELASGPVTIRGEAAATIYRAGQALTLRVPDSGWRADGAHCMTELTQDRFGQERIKVECESPRLDRAGMRVLATEYAREWSSGRPFSPSPRWILSPVDRDQAYINIALNPRQNNPFYMPRAVIPTAQVEITPYQTLGEVVVSYELRDVDLRKSLVLPSGRQLGDLPRALRLIAPADSRH